MTTALAHIAWRPVLGVALTLALASIAVADTKQASASRAIGRPTELDSVGRAPLAGAGPAAHNAAARSRYGWPVKPFHRQHPVRGFFGDPRISNHGRNRQFHFGVDISAPNDTPVYATLTGRVRIHPLHRDTVLIDGAGGLEFSYWHVIPTVRTGQRVVAYRTMIGRVESPYAHVHFSEARHGRYLNPLRPGAMGPFADATRPDVRSVVVERDGGLALVAETYDETPIAVPRPWHDLPVMPVLVRWRLLGTGGRVILGWRTAVDFRETIPPASAFDTIWAPGTTQNHVRAPGRYRVFLMRGGLHAGRYVVQVEVRDVVRNASTSRLPLVVRG